MNSILKMITEDLSEFLGMITVEELASNKRLARELLGLRQALDGRAGSCL